MNQGPTGRVTLVFTDVEGSTELWDQVPEAMSQALTLHDQILRQQIAAHRGYEVKTEGDAFMVAFGDSNAAVAWCLACQTALVEAAWPDDLLRHSKAAPASGVSGALIHRGLRVRMGAHTGDPEVRKDPLTGRSDYYGGMVNRAARVSGAAHGGQILISLACAEELIALDADRKDFGAHNLRGLSTPESLTQVLPNDLVERRFPPLRVHAVARHNLPGGLPPLLGRNDEIAALDALCTDHRVVSLLGPGGMGKSHLAIAFGHYILQRYGAGIWFCGLAEVRSAEGIVQAVSSALAIPLLATENLRELVDQLGRAIAYRGRIMVILDNFEQVTDHADATVARWSEMAPEATFLITSRNRLHVRGESVFRLGPLSVDAGAKLLEGAWNERGLKADENTVLTRIAERLEGIPLALTLAASRGRLLTPNQVEQRLDKRLSWRSGQSGTLRATIAWSWDLLEPWEFEAMVQLATFQGGFRIDAVEQVLELPTDAPPLLDVVADLLDKSMLRSWLPAELSDEQRFGMYETVREFALEKLEGDARCVQFLDRHADWALADAERFAAATEGSGVLLAAARLGLDQENYLAAYRHCAIERGVDAARLVLSLADLWSLRGPTSMIEHYLPQAIERLGHAEPALQARLLRGASTVYSSKGRLVGRGALERAVTLARQSGDDALLLEMLTALMYQYGMTGDWQEFDRCLPQAKALADKLGDEVLYAGYEMALGLGAYMRGNTLEALRAWHAALPLLERRDIVGSKLTATLNLAVLYTELDQAEEAERFHGMALAMSQAHGNLMAGGICHANYGNFLRLTDRWGESEKHYRQAIQIHQQTGNNGYLNPAQSNFAALLVMQGRRREARALFDTVFARSDGAGNKGRNMGYASCSCAGLEALEGDVKTTQAKIERARDIFAGHDDPRGLDTVNVASACIALARAFAGEISSEKAVAIARKRIAWAHETDPKRGRTPAQETDDVRIAIRIVERVIVELEGADEGTHATTRQDEAIQTSMLDVELPDEADSPFS